MLNGSNLAQEAEGEWMNSKYPETISGFSFDTRSINPGDLFLALKGENRDGHEYLEQAFQKGASGAIVERFNKDLERPQLQVKDTLKAIQKIATAHRERFKGLVIGVTGSCGKTTTKDLLTRLLGQDRTHATYSNNNNLLGVPLTLLGMDPQNHAYGVIEAGINLIGEMQFLAQMIRPDLSIITNICPVHLEGLKTLENIAYEKGFLAEATKEGEGVVLFPKECLRFEKFRSLGKKARILAYEGEAVETQEDQVLYYKTEENKNKTMTLAIRLPGSSYQKEYILPILSEGILSNVALAISACLLIGIEKGQIEERLKGWGPSQHRGQIFHHAQKTYYADCYNANPVAMHDALDIFQRQFDNTYKHLYILGCMGELGEGSDQYHYEVGNSLKLNPNDQILLLGDNAKDYARGLRDRGNSESQIICLQKRENIFDYLKCFEGAVFLKGSKRYALWEFLPDKG